MNAPTKLCPVCGEQIMAVARKCRHCGEYLDPALKAATATPEYDSGMRMLLPVGRSGWAIAAGYFGLFAVLPGFCLVAIIVALIALNDLRYRPQVLGRGRAIFGLVMGVLFTVLYGLMLLAAIASS